MRNYTFWEVKPGWDIHNECKVYLNGELLGYKYIVRWKRRAGK